jgi:D-lactate dehydrogenase
LGDQGRGGTVNIVVFEAEQRERAAFKRLAQMDELRLIAEPLTEDNAKGYAEAEIVSPFIYSTLNRNTLRAFPKLRLIATRSTGYDHIDVAECRKRSIAVCNVPSYGENTVAEHVFALLLALSHRILEAVERARTSRFSPEGLQGFDLAGKTMGVVGTGNIGRHVIRIARGFAMNVLACDVKPDAELAAALGFRYVTLDALLAESDVVSLHVPATDQTRDLISDHAFARMKTGAVLINTSRGSVVDSRTLIEALHSGKISAAGLDVLPAEPLIREEAQLISSIYGGQFNLADLVADHVLLRMPNVIVTPHSGFNTREAVQRIVETTVLNIESFLNGDPRNLVPESRIS